MSDPALFPTPSGKKNEALETGIDMPQFSADELRNRTIAAINSLSADTKILVFGCDNTFDVSMLESPGVAVLKAYCIGMLPSTLIEYALKKGADGILITGCRTGDCYFRYGNVWLDKRFDGNRQPRLRARADRRRIMVARGAETDGAKIKRALADFQQTISELNASEPARPEAGRNNGVDHVSA